MFGIRKKSALAGELAVADKGTKEIKLVLPPPLSMLELIGHHDEFLKIIEDGFAATILVRGNEISISGNAKEADLALGFFEQLVELVQAGNKLDAQSVRLGLEMARRGSSPRPKDVFGDVVLVFRGRSISPRTAGQKRYVDAIREKTATFGIGPAGTGKTYLAMAMAVDALKRKQVSRIILTRPAVEAGEKLGFLPGTLSEKVDPYLRPLYDALYSMLEAGEFQQWLDSGVVEVAPLAFMRGRTLNDAFIILDEAQNTSPEQMKMFLTRLGFGSRIVVTGDVTQIDLPVGQRSGLLVVEKILTDIDDLAFVHLTADDVIRHSLVQRIVEAYRESEEQRQPRQSR